MPAILPSANRLPLATKPAHPAAPTKLGGPGSCLCMLKFFHKQSVTSSAGNLHSNHTGLLAAKRLQWQLAACSSLCGDFGAARMYPSHASLCFVASCWWRNSDSRHHKYCGWHNCKHTDQGAAGHRCTAPSPAPAWIMQDTFLLHVGTRTSLISLQLVHFRSGPRPF